MKEIAYVLVNPYTIRKSRLGGVLARYLSRTDLKLVAARMFGASQGLVEDYARAVVERTDSTPHIDTLLDDIAAGRKYMKVYKQMKMYNDADTNPVLYGGTTDRRKA